MKVFLLIIGSCALILIALIYPATWWQKPPARQRDKFIGKLLPFLDISLRNLLLRGLFLALTFYLYLTAIIWVPLFAAAIVPILILGGAWRRLRGHRAVPVSGLILLIVLGVIFLIGLLAPLRLMSIAGYLALGKPAGNIWEALAVGPGWLTIDSVIGLCGFFGVASWMVADAFWRSRQAAQVDNLATSKIGALALGLVEVKGIVLPLPKAPARPAVELTYGSFNYFQSTQHIEPFHLTDSTGSVLVDATECRVRAGWIAELAAIFGVREIVLRRRKIRDDFTDSVTKRLEYGDRVYVIGTAERDDTGNLVIRPASRPGWNEVLWRTFFGVIRPPRGKDIHDVFFLTDGGESQARQHIRKGLRRVLGWGLVWLISSLLVAWTAHQPWRKAPPLDSWRNATWRGPDPNPDPRVIDYTRNQRLFRFEKYLKSPLAGSPEAVPALVEALHYRDGRFREQAIRTLLPLLGHVRAAQVLPALIDNLQSRNASLRQLTILTLERLGPEASPAVPALIGQLQCINTNTYEVSPAILRAAAARALGAIGPVARDARPALNDALEDETEVVRKASRRALEQINGQHSG